MSLAWRIWIVVAALLSTSTLRAQEHDATAHADAHGAAAHGADAHGATAHGDEHGHGPYSLRTDLPFWSMIAFIGFVLAIKGLGLWDLLLGNMSQRETSEAAAISGAEAQLTTAQSSLKQIRGQVESLDEVIRETLAEADRDAASTRQDILAAAEAEAISHQDRARFEIDRVTNQSLHDIFESLADQVAKRTEQRLRTGLQAADQERFIDATLGQLSAEHN